MRKLLFSSAVLFLTLSTADAQYGPGPTSGTSASDLAAAMAALSASIPQPASIIPLQPNGMGAVGSANTYVPSDAAQRQTVQRTTVTTDASGNWTVTWATAFTSSSPTINPIPLNSGGTNPYVCNVTSRSSTAATGKCWQTTSQTVGLISLTVSLAPTSVPISVPVMVIGAEPTQ